MLFIDFTASSFLFLSPNQKKKTLWFIQSKKKKKPEKKLAQQTSQIAAFCFFGLHGPQVFTGPVTVSESFAFDFCSQVRITSSKITPPI